MIQPPCSTPINNDIFPSSISSSLLSEMLWPLHVSVCKKYFLCLACILYNIIRVFFCVLRNLVFFFLQLSNLTNVCVSEKFNIQWKLIALLTSLYCQALKKSSQEISFKGHAMKPSSALDVSELNKNSIYFFYIYIHIILMHPEPKCKRPVNHKR